MWHSNGSFSPGKKEVGNGLIVVAIDKDKGSPHALRWAVEHLLSRGQTVVLIHVIKPAHTETSTSIPTKHAKDKVSKELFLSYHCFCTRKDIHCLDIVLEDSDVVKALTEYVSHVAIQKLILGAPTRSGFMRKSRADIPTCVTKAAPDFCTVYTILKGKIFSIRNATRSAPLSSPLVDQLTKLSSSFIDDHAMDDTAAKQAADKPIAKSRSSLNGASRIYFQAMKDEIIQRLSNMESAQKDLRDQLDEVAKGLKELTNYVLKSQEETQKQVVWMMEAIKKISQSPTAKQKISDVLPINSAPL